MIGGRAEMETEMDYDAADNSAKCYVVAIEALRERLASFRCEEIGACKLYLGDCRELLPLLPRADHIISDPPYESVMHDSKNGRAPARIDGGNDLRGLDFAPIDDIRGEVVRLAHDGCGGWFIVFCTVEGVSKWADAINPSPLKYKRACIWIKPDSTPQLNGQGPAQGAECFVAAWAGRGHAKWNSGGKRGVYTHCVNGPHRHGEHPTEKPASLMREIVLDFTAQGDLVCDPFMGSGTTGVACVRLGRRFVGIEVEQKWFDIACRRIEAATKQPDLFIEQPKKAEQLNLLESAP